MLKFGTRYMGIDLLYCYLSFVYFKSVHNNKLKTGGKSRFRCIKIE